MKKLSPVIEYDVDVNVVNAPVFGKRLPIAAGDCHVFDKRVAALAEFSVAIYAEFTETPLPLTEIPVLAFTDNEPEVVISPLSPSPP